MKPEALLYKAQTIGNIEPIEYMIPYPSTQALIEGKTLKFGDQIIYEDYKITNIDFYKLVQKTANWLNDKGIQPKENVLIEDIGSPHTFLLLYGIWHLGARATLIDDSNNKVNNKLPIKKINLENNLLETIYSFPSDFTPKYKALLNETAVNIISKNNIIFLSHYGLLVNANSIQKSINLNAGERFFCDLLPTSSFWVVINAILPIYAGCIYTKKNPKITITFNEIDKESGYQLRTDWENLNDFKNHHIAVCVENSAAICINNNPIHLTDFKIKPKKLLVKGHSVMNGYLNKNNMLFENDYLAIQK
tara:strand:- start:10512 stop:11429 length:918 start_codon:yes stop_codon:yes gene_type:complete